LRGYFFLVFLVAFFFIVLLSLGLDFVDLAAALPGFLFTGIGTSSRVRCCGLSLKTFALSDAV
jgi:hypothetical protein